MKKFLNLLVCFLVGTTSMFAALASTFNIPDGLQHFDYIAPDWADYTNIEVYGSEGWVYNYNKSSNSNYDYNRFYFKNDGVHEGETLYMTFETTEVATVRFSFITHNFVGTLNIYCDNQLESTFKNENPNHDHDFTPFNYSIEVGVGAHEVKIMCDGEGGNISYFGVYNSPLISANLIEPGSLGTEILYNDVESLQDVRKLKIIGEMNDDDWDKIGMMRDRLSYLDLSEAKITSIPKRAFYECGFLHTVILPEGLIYIGDSAFNRSGINNINFPSTLRKIEGGAFFHTLLTEVILPDATTDISTYTFAYSSFLKYIRLSNNLNNIPARCFEGCYNLQNFDLPQTLQRIEEYAFCECYWINMELPRSINYIGKCAFLGTNSRENYKENLIIPSNCSFIGQNAFEQCLYTYAEVPVILSSIDQSNIFGPNITKLRLNSPTVIKSTSIVSDKLRSNITLEVPSFLVNSYKLDNYWYNFKEIIGFDPSEIDEWTICSDLVLGAHDRMTGAPSINIYSYGSLKINGSDPMPINNLSWDVDYGWNPVCYGQIFSNTEGVSINGDLSMRFKFLRNTWYFQSLPFDVKVSDIVQNDGVGVQNAIRYYDGENRAENGASGNWKDFNDTDIIPAGTGFIIMVDQDSWWLFPSQENESKQYVTSTNMFVKPLAQNPSNTESNRGWNYIGNPYQCYYNIHKLNFTAPITVREGSNYKAYSIIDDDYALRPNQAFFVQCPQGIGTISFPLDGRQMTSEIKSQQGAAPLNPSTPSRRIIDLEISNDINYDCTRVVFNDAASMDYEITCDASKFFTEDLSVPQIYSVNSDELYSINERPMLDGTVTIGFKAGVAGTYSISLARCNVEEVYLIDNYTGESVDLKASAGYQFTTIDGTFDDRFELSVDASVTSINSISNQQFRVETEANGVNISGVDGNVEIYNLAGIKVAESHPKGNINISLPKGCYIVRSGNKTAKAVVL